MRLLTPLLLLAIGCSQGSERAPGAPDIDFDVEPDELAAGDSITLELENDTRQTVSYNLCSSTLERQAAGAWERVPETRMCTRELRILEPDRDVHYRLGLPADLTPGTYRFRTGVQLGDAASHEVTSETFRVR